ncbi:hypothetical protein, partial [Mesorhizobium sp. L2C085B000]
PIFTLGADECFGTRATLDNVCHRKILLMMSLPESFIFVIGQLEKSIAWIGIHLRNECILVHFALRRAVAGSQAAGTRPGNRPNIHTQRTVQETL